MGRRKISDSGFYHVVTKGEADQILFFSDFDRQDYVNLLEEVTTENDLRVHAYCIMSNHVHLLLEDRKRHLSDGMKSINERFAQRFKRRTGNTGHVFKNRFWSEPIEDDAYLLCAMRYIHANPVAAGICKASAYPWSSARDYLGRAGITYTELILNMVGGRKGFIAFSKREPPTALPFPGSTFKNHLSDDELLRIAHDAVGEQAIRNARSLLGKKRAALVGTLKACGFSMRQVSRLTGLSKAAVQACWR